MIWDILESKRLELIVNSSLEIRQLFSYAKNSNLFYCQIALVIFNDIA